MAACHLLLRMVSRSRRRAVSSPSRSWTRWALISCASMRSICRDLWASSSPAQRLPTSWRCNIVCQARSTDLSVLSRSCLCSTCAPRAEQRGVPSSGAGSSTRRRSCCCSTSARRRHRRSLESPAASRKSSGSSPCSDIASRKHWLRQAARSATSPPACRRSASATYCGSGCVACSWMGIFRRDDLGVDASHFGVQDVCGVLPLEVTLHPVSALFAVADSVALPASVALVESEDDSVPVLGFFSPSEVLEKSSPGARERGTGLAGSASEDFDGSRLPLRDDRQPCRTSSCAHLAASAIMRPSASAPLRGTEGAAVAGQGAPA
mmetsp:Transcript_81501/g.219042  ORF Transcript_81501/g.219042 Transcript_81501/m.219042 type:complete len:322 (-) Transcript_81501:7-972(-)